MIFATVLFAICSVSLSQAYVVQDEVVKVSLYYESLCPGCEGFIANQLYPGYQQLKDSLVIDLILYGNAYRFQVDGKWQFDCQHGPDECHGNLIAACVVGNKDLTQDQVVGFVGCMAQSGNSASDKNGEKCAAENNLSWDDIITCAQSDSGAELLAHFGEIQDALNPPLTYVPYIWFNDAFDENLEYQAVDDFVATVCSLLKVKPSACNQ